MGASRRSRGGKAWCAAGALALLAPAALALTGCEPAGGGLDVSTVSYTTGDLAAARLKQAGYDVAWLDCLGKADAGGGTPASGSPRPVTAVGVDCKGMTADKRAIIVYGRVTGIDGTSCLRGRLTAKVAGKEVFTASVLGDCSGTGTATGRATGTDTAAPGTPTAECTCPPGASPSPTGAPPKKPQKPQKPPHKPPPSPPSPTCTPDPPGGKQQHPPAAK
ncbi:hypothetical protein ACFP1Z_08300 [Streptomyces gamaensis]|uniref:Lipoprotein n=1 Tax=Streptomyces gamaensis TaxID=1763542 RepID=A0ABW0YWN4_9ACTN